MELQLVSQTPSPNITPLTCWCSCVWMEADPASTFQHLAKFLPFRAHSVREDHLHINSQAHMMVPLAILAQRLQQQRGGSVRDGGGDGEWMSICVLSPVTSYKLPRIDSLLSYTNKYGTTHSVHTNTHICAPAAHSLSKIQFQRWPVRRTFWPLSGKEFESRCLRKWERSRSRGSL